MAMIDVSYGFTRTLNGVSCAAARERVEAALKTEGFGILTEIDVQSTLKAKLGVEFPEYRILGVCNPALAHRALGIDPGVGLLLPCTVVIAADRSGNAEVSVLDPEAMMRIVPDGGLFHGVMGEARERLQRALAKV
jgi:uncharacterized protein (DUF302 family)